MHRWRCEYSRQQQLFLCLFSESRYREFLGRLCAEEGGVHTGNGDEAGTDVSLGNWSGLRCRVEEGFSRVSKVLEDGTIQVSYDTIW